jgi:rhomboid protease GluP
MILSGVNILMPDKQSMIHWGANFRPITLEGQWWRVFTAGFIHFGILHLVLNMYALSYIGLILEPHLGRTRFFATYILTGVASGMTSLWWNHFVISAGASGAIFGMYGAFIALATTDLFDKSFVKKPLLISIVVFVGYNLANGLKPNSGIDNAAHIGGLIAGIIIGYAFVPSLKQKQNLRLKYATMAILTTILLISSAIIYNSLPNDFAIYQSKLKKFIVIESMALKVYRLPKGTPQKEILSEIKDRDLYYWNEDLKLVESFKNLNLPPIIREKNRKLKEYSELRIKSYKLIYKDVKENTNKYLPQIKKYNREIEKLLNEFKE